MSHVSLIDATQTTADRAAVLTQIEQAFGTVPDMLSRRRSEDRRRPALRAPYRRAAWSSQQR